MASASAGAGAPEGRAQKPVHVMVAAKPIAEALNDLARQTGLQVVINSSTASGIHSETLEGDFTPEDALRRLLESTGLIYEYLNNDTVSIRRPEAASVTGAAKAGTVSAAGGSGASATEELEEIQVVGRKPFTDANVDIVRTENDAQPYYIFKAAEIEQANTVNLEEFLKQRLTMNTVSRTMSQGTSNGRTFSSANLRGLGTNQTLILVNGRRTGGSNDQQFDVNAFAPSMIDRVEVLPSSASAIYGGSAVGGVINIVLKRDFVGGDIQLTYDTPLDTHAPVRSVATGYGWSLEDGRTNITLSASFRDSEAVTFGDRSELYERGLSRIRARAPGLLYSANFPAQFGSTPNIASANGSALVFDDGTPLGSSLTYIPTGTSPSTSLAALQAGLLANAGGQNTTPGRGGALATISGLRAPLGAEAAESRSVTGAIRRKMTDRFELIGELMYNSNEGSGHPSNRLSVIIPADSPTNPFQQAVRVTPPLNDNLGFYSFKAESLRAVLGFVLDLPNDWRVQGDYTWNRAKFPLEEGCFDCASGEIASEEAFADGTLNPFLDTLAYPLQIGPYTTVADRAKASEQDYTLADIGLRMSGPVGTLPAGQPNLTIGLGYREEKFEGGYSDLAAFGRTTYFPQSQNVTSVYAEALVPLIAAANDVPGVRLLDLQIASRFENYSVSSGTCCRDTFPPDYEVDPAEELQREQVDYSSTSVTVGLRYKPVESFTVRASYATAFLPPAFGELLPDPVDPEPVSFFGALDPQRGNEQVYATDLTGGNPNIDPMDAETFSVGFLFEPQFLKGLRVGLDWFRIERSHLIFEPSASLILLNQELFANRITRAAPEAGDPYSVGPITQLDRRLVNVSHVAMEGFDVTLGYSHATERLGVFSFDLAVTMIDSFTRVLSPESAEEDIAGQVANGGPLKLRANATLGWERGNWSLGWTTLYYGPYDQYDSPLYLAAQGGTTVSHQVYHNLFAGYRFADQGRVGVLSNTSITLGMRNVFNTLPPFDAYAGGRGSAFYSNFGDPRLRAIQMSVGKRF
ncbi:TonB-dependent receptor [Steroidobacter sp.]|uniref:TonB-dependent receptor n=1 Tax=Steroidobacter sp. TaxID=1978227 RepID=UPI001A3C90F7|nr:TonB-dependent receptor [Steroidobacter sp.]MBL8269205.1 TonB-dependent receptor [Steroidobacter sp.]